MSCRVLPSLLRSSEYGWSACGSAHIGHTIVIFVETLRAGVWRTFQNFDKSSLTVVLKFLAYHYPGLVIRIRDNVGARDNMYIYVGEEYVQVKQV